MPESPGSCLISLGFRTESGACADEMLRKTIRGAIDRQELVQQVELGHADPSLSYSAPSIAIWPASTTRVDPPRPKERVRPALRLLARADSDFQPALAHAIAMQLRLASRSTDVVLLRGEAFARAVESGAFDMRIESTWGVPYDPDISLGARFGPPLRRRAAATPSTSGRDARVTELVIAAQCEWDEVRRTRIYGAIQERIDEVALLVPLYAPRRFALLRADLPPPVLDHDLYRIDAASLARARVVQKP